VTVELLTMAAVFVGGCALLRGFGLTGWALPPLGLIVGICLLVEVGFGQLVTGAPGSPVITLVIISGVPLAWCALRLRREPDLGRSLVPVAAGLAAVCAAVPVLRTVNMVKWHSDSLEYLSAGRLIAEGRYRSLAPSSMLSTRVLGVPLLHTPANLSGELYLRSITPLLWLATVASLIWLLYNAMRTGTDRRWRTVLIVLTVLWLATNNRVASNTFYLNGHLLTAALLLLIAGPGWLAASSAGADRAPRRALLALQLLAVPALVLARPEGALMAALAILPALLSDRFSPRHRSILLATLCICAALLTGFEVWLFHARGTTIPVSITAPGALWLLLLLAVPLMQWGLPGRGGHGWGRPGWRLPGWLLVQRYPVLLLAIVEGGLWLGLAAYTLRSSQVLVDSARATSDNLVHGQGGWGIFVVLLCALLLAAMLLLRLPNQAILRFPVTTFLPLVFLLAYLREGSYRVGDTDSLNRMVMHIVPLGVAYLALLLTIGRPVGRRVPRPPATQPPAQPAQPAASPRPRSLARLH
jgi:hypothetical protein